MDKTEKNITMKMKDKEKQDKRIKAIQIIGLVQIENGTTENLIESIMEII